MRKITLLIVVLAALFVSAAAADSNITVVPMHMGAAECAQFVEWFPGPCLQNVMVLVGSPDNSLVAYQVTLTYLDSNGSPQAQTQVVLRPIDGWGAVRFYGNDMTGILARVVGLTQSSNSIEVKVP